MTWETLWMLGSAGLALFGFVGRQIVHFFVGAKAIVKGDDETPEYSAIEEQVLPGRVANRAFKDEVSRQALGTKAGNVFFWILCVGLVAHAGFWVYAVAFLND